jgi:cytohesin
VSDPVLNDSGMTELHLAAYHGDPEWVAACIAGGLELTARSNNGYTPLHWAVDMGCVGPRADRIAVVRALVEAGADVKAKTRSGETPATTARHSTSEYLIPYLRKGR